MKPLAFLNFIPNEELIQFFHCKKTEMSCMEQPNTFLNQLRDHDLVPEKLYKKVIRMRYKEKKKDGVYEVLDRLEKERSDKVKVFWRCVFHGHILQKYPVLCGLRKSLMDGSYKFYAKLLDSEELKDSPQSEENTAKKQRRRNKRKKSVEETEDDEQPSPSSSSSPNQQKSPKKPKFCSQPQMAVGSLGIKLLTIGQMLFCCTTQEPDRDLLKMLNISAS
ncbi:uncharacterized protein LOC113587835 [Electrophorus electricus]|uniref:uncharacterized protein LOC113587835 n=1 Tax=Electrophorus electricus TaxID=8005 RepID=UPI000F0A2469|nr:uncharacterized protein LOC113587835 [Electrophorus electricus]